MSRDRKYDAPEFAPLAIVCTGPCGEVIVGEPACADCDRCGSCMPGDRCWACKELRREDEADRLLRLSKEARSW